MAYTKKQKQSEISRELNMRRRVYPRLVAQGRMTQEEADGLISIMESIWNDYAEKPDKKQLVMPLQVANE